MSSVHHSSKFDCNHVISSFFYFLYLSPLSISWIFRHWRLVVRILCAIPPKKGIKSDKTEIRLRRVKILCELHQDNSCVKFFSGTNTRKLLVEDEIVKLLSRAFSTLIHSHRQERHFSAEEKNEPFCIRGSSLALREKI